VVWQGRRARCTDRLVYNTLKCRGKHGVKAKAAAQSLDYDGLLQTAATLVSGKCMGEGRDRRHDCAAEGSAAGIQDAVRGGHGVGPVSKVLCLGSIGMTKTTQNTPCIYLHPLSLRRWRQRAAGRVQRLGCGVRLGAQRFSQRAQLTQRQSETCTTLDWPDTGRAWWAADGAWSACGRVERAACAAALPPPAERDYPLAKGSDNPPQDAGPEMLSK
jgi:hypothetical protein